MHMGVIYPRVGIVVQLRKELREKGRRIKSPTPWRRPVEGREVIHG